MIVETAFNKEVNMKIILMLFMFITLLSSPVWSWDFSKHAVSLDEIMSGGPPKDGIPALMNPGYVSGKDADFMREDEQVMGVYLNGVARAFPTRILSWHELVNDKFGDLPVLVSW